MKKIRTRYAPSPTGYLHIGGARTALFCYLFAKHHQGEFIVRTEDTDVERNIVDGERSQLENLKWLGIIPDESALNPNIKYGKYRQSERLDIYKKYIDQLLSEKKAYKCFCSKEQLEEDRLKQEKNGISPKYSRRCRNLSNEEILQKEKAGLPFSIRLKIPDDEIISWNDEVRGKIEINSNDINDFVILRPNNMPTYNFCVVIDDHLMEITNVHRGEEHISNTPKQLILFKMLGWEPPEICHLTIITNMEGKKLSKRDTSTFQFIEDYKKQGFVPEAVFNFLALLGWSPNNEKEILTKEELIELFDTSRFSKSPSKFDLEKLKWFSSQYIKNMDQEIYLGYVKEHLLGEIDENKKILALAFKRQIENFAQINELFTSLFSPKDDFENCKNILNETCENDFISLLKNKIAQCSFANLDTVKNMIKDIGNLTNRKGRMLFAPIRILTTKCAHGPELPVCLFVIGKEKCLENIESFIRGGCAK